jgi:hypothetical protein
MVPWNVRSHSPGVVLLLFLLLLLIPRSAAAADVLVYSNTIGSPNHYMPGAGIFVSDDVGLGDPASVSKIEIRTFSSGNDPYTVTISLFSGDPCVGTPSQIPNSSRTFTDVQPGTELVIIDYGQAIDVPATVYVKVVFGGTGGGDAQWAIGEIPELGTSADRICLDQSGGGGNPGYLNLGSLHASMWVQVWEESTPVVPQSWGVLKDRYRTP